MLLKNKVAVIYGAGGAIGGAVAKAFAREGANVFLAGRTLAKLEAVAAEITNLGGMAAADQVDALNHQEVDAYLDGIIGKAGNVDISFNAIDFGETQGGPLTEMPSHRFTQPILNAMTTHFITGTAAARRMAKNRSGVILAITANVAREAFPNVGGFGVACAAIEGFCRQLAADVGPQGIRVVCLRSAGSPDSPGVKAAMSLHAQNAGVPHTEFETKMAERTLLKRLPLLAEVANAAVLMASDQASSMTAAIANVTCGQIVD
jgi:NAD(P)-dependent dehydrogenase (short-subunit alcohol dehydrogenase family)